METYLFDLGFYDQLIWLVSRGKPLYTSLLQVHPWVDHFSPSIFLLVPLYWLGGGAKTLVTFQAMFACLGAYPIYILALKKTKSYLFSLVLAFSYLAYYGLQNALSFDFHPVTLGATLLAFMFLFYEEKKFRLFWILLIIFVGLQENFFILAAAFGIFLMVRYRDYKRGLIVTLGSLTFITVLLFFLIPRYVGQSYLYLPEHLRKMDVPEIVRMLYLPDSKIDVVAYSFLAFGGLAFFYPPVFILLAEEYLGRFLATTNSNWWILGFHYNAILGPIMAYGATEAVRKYFRKKEVVPTACLIIGVILSQARVKTDIYKMFNLNYYNLSKTQDAGEVLPLISKGASLASTNDLGAQVAHRRTLIFLSDCMNKNIGYDRKPCYKLKPDYILVNLDPNGASNNVYPELTTDDVYQYINSLLDSKEYILSIKKGNVYLLKKDE